MDYKVIRLTQVLRAYDPLLFAVRIGPMVQIHRKLDGFKTTNGYQEELLPEDVHPQFILALSDTWKANGNPADWGIEPVMEMIRGMDSWNDEDSYYTMVKRRESESVDKKRSFRNEIRARAHDMRRDFARATNDINTSSLAKTDLRREKNGYC